MTTAQFVAGLLQEGVSLWIEGDQLRFRAHKSVLNSALREELSNRKTEIISLLEPNKKYASLSCAQKQLWFLSQLHPENSFYNIPVAVRLTGQLDLMALEQSVSEIVRRHESLRTTFTILDGQPAQEISPTLDVPLSTVDLRALAGTEREVTVRRLSTTEALRPFDLARGPLLRVTLLCLDEDEHVLLLTMHHIISDGWSLGVLNHELAALYTAFVAGSPSPLQALPVQYADYTAWQREQLSAKTLDSQLAYWRRQLDGLQPLTLPTDRPQQAAPNYRSGLENLKLPGALVEALARLGRREGATLFTTLLAAFQALLSRYSGQEDIAVGSPIAGRNRAETEGLIGFFVNTLVMRTDLSGDPTFRELLGRVREVASEAYAHQELPFQKLVQELRPERDLSRNPLFQVLFVKQNAPTQALLFSGLTLEPMELGFQTTQFNLELHLYKESEGLRVTAVYSTDLFDSVTISRMLGHFRTLLEGIVANPEQRISELPLLTESERHQMVVEWNDTAKDYPRGRCIHELFEEQVGRTPDAVAMVSEDQQLTYRELNRRASQLAHYLRKLGVGPEVAVGICLERSVEMVVGLLGVLKAGGAYVPLDPSYPPEHLAFVLADVCAPVLLTQAGLSEGLPKAGAKTVRLDAEREALARESGKNPASSATAENLAYLIYTSGSTGKPKGVAIEHRSAVALLHWARDAFAPERLAGVLAATSICFDLSVFELFAPLSWGGKVILAESVLRLPELPAAEEVTLINTVPSAMAELVRTGGAPGSVRTVNLAGEPLRTSLVQQIYRQGEIERVYDLYGPSEDTTYSTFALRSPSGPATVGRPVANTRVYLLDGDLNPVPIGVPGELYIGGEGLARGYLNRPQLTAEKFVPDPFSGERGARLYRTGDLVRYLPDGNIEFLGRTDQQVKVRGFRVEPGEIEAVLGQHPDVREVVLVACKDGNGDECLVAYIVAACEPAPSVSELRGYLKEKLPEYMVPTAFTVLEELPLTPSGKVDRQALPAPEGHLRAKLERDLVAPRDELEEALVGIWEEVLGIERIGVHDDFFELGGHSLLTTRVVSRLRDTLQVELSVRSLFEAPTVEELAVEITQYQAENVDPKEMTRMLAELEKPFWDEECL